MPTPPVTLRELTDSDLPVFFEQQLDPQANYLAAFTTKDPSNRSNFDNHWAKIRSNPTITTRTIVVAGTQVAGYISSFEEEGHLELTYWLGRQYWGQGIATAALSQFLDLVKTRPLYARVAIDNPGSRRVLEKCGFTVYGQDKGFANARGTETQELLLKLL